VTRVTSDLESRLRELSELRDGWDGDGASAPSATAIHHARRILAGARVPDEVDPDAVGGVAFWYRGPGRRDVACYCRNGGDVVVVSYQDGAWTDQSTVRAGAAVWERLGKEAMIDSAVKILAGALKGAAA
jgi:hypothetical protein